MDSTLINFWLRNLGDWLYLPMQFFTFLGYQQFYILFLALIYWCLSPRLGARLAIGLLLCAISNGILKLAFHSPRPYWIDAHIQPLGTEGSFGMPSGHAQNGIVFWGIMADGLRSTPFSAIAIFTILLIGVSRLYLGVHFLGDVLVGWVIGAVLLVLFLHLEKPFLNWFNRKRLGGKVLFLLMISWGFLVLTLAVRYSLRLWVIPAEWLSLSARFSEARPINPLGIKDLMDGAGIFFGISTGFVQISDRGWFDPAGSLVQKIARCLFGLLGALFIWLGLKLVLPAGEGWVPWIFSNLHYALLGYWVSYLAPLTFQRLKLLPCRRLAAAR